MLLRTGRTIFLPSVSTFFVRDIANLLRFVLSTAGPPEGNPPTLLSLTTFVRSFFKLVGM